MKILITGICGFVGSTLAKALAETDISPEVIGIDSFVRPGSETNRPDLQQRGIRVLHGDVRSASDFEVLPAVDWVIDAAANPSVLAGVDGHTSSRQLLEHNLGGTVNLLEFCKQHGAGFILLSTSRVYSMPQLAGLAMDTINDAFSPNAGQSFPRGISRAGVSEDCSTEPPLSLYGSSKLASEVLALEYGHAFNFPVWINRCGVLAGGGQFGRPDQGILAYWINAHLRRRPMVYMGFGGNGYQVRDAMHPVDLLPVLCDQMTGENREKPRICNFGGGTENATSLAQLTAWCDERFGPHVVAPHPLERPFDIPWMVMDCGRALETWNWQPATPLTAILDEISEHANDHPDWLDISTPVA